jgi:NAD(P)-dependent dehydrogenase (short-subunit alcohol dehydrogenase family)
MLSNTVGKLAASFQLDGRVAVITGGAGLLGEQHGRAIARAGGTPVLIDINGTRAEAIAKNIAEEFSVPTLGVATDITNPESVQHLLEKLLQKFGHVDILINNAANNPTPTSSIGAHELAGVDGINFSQFENFPMQQWHDDINVGLTGAMVCSQILGTHMALQRRGVILNIASDLALIGPDQRLYRRPGMPDALQPVKPVSYSVVKAALLGLTRYLATYWAECGVRVNAISHGGVLNGQPEDFLNKINSLIPLGRMANVDEYQGAILFLCSDASSYMTGANLVVDGGRTCW